MTIYVITASGGEYEDSWSINKFATTDKIKADLKVCELISDRREYLKALEKLAILRASIHEELGPIRCEKIDRPRLPSESLNITQEMRDERNKINLLNDQYRQHYHEAHAAREVIIASREVELLNFLGYPAGHDIYNHWSRSTKDVNYEVDEVEEL